MEVFLRSCKVDRSKVLMIYKKCTTERSGSKDRSIWTWNNEISSKKFIIKNLSTNFRKGITMTSPKSDNNTQLSWWMNSKELRKLSILNFSIKRKWSSNWCHFSNKLKWQFLICNTQRTIKYLNFTDEFYNYKAFMTVVKSPFTVN